MNPASLRTDRTDHDNLCYGWKWFVADKNKLAEQVALIALGQSRHVMMILQDPSMPRLEIDVDSKTEAINHIAAAQDISHRNGWLFQAISWIAANSESSDTLTRIPQYPKAHKGFDNFQVKMDSTNSTIIGVIISEDKATVNARKVVRDDIFPEFSKIENRKKMPELTHEVNGMIAECVIANRDFDIHNAIRSTLWESSISYRISITVEDIQLSNAKRRDIFVGFDDAVPREVNRRIANTFHIDTLSEWMQEFAELVIIKIKGT